MTLHPRPPLTSPHLPSPHLPSPPLAPPLPPQVYLEALEFSPENPELLTTVGLLYLRLGENYKAFDFLGNSLTHDPRNPKTILAAGSIIQDHQVTPTSHTTPRHPYLPHHPYPPRTIP